MTRKICSLSLLVFLSSAVASAQVKLEQKFPEGTKFTVNTEEKSKFVLALEGMNYDSTMTAFLVSTTTIGQRDSNGALKYEEKVDSLQSETTIPGGLTLRFDSTDSRKKADAPEFEIHLDSLRAFCLPVTVSLDAANKIAAVSLPDGEFEKLSDVTKIHFNSDALKKTAERHRAFLPGEPVKLGDTWERFTEVQLGSGHVINFRTKFEYAGTIEADGLTLDKITGKVVDVNYRIQDRVEVQLQAPASTVTESESTYLFDRGRGILISRTTKTRFGGPMKITAEGMQFEGTFDMTMEEKAVRQK